MKHKHADLIKAWADGAIIEYQWPYRPGTWEICEYPKWDTNCCYRIKPVPIPPDVHSKGSPENIAQLIATDPSKGEATHYSMYGGHGNKYHLLKDGVWAYWLDGPYAHWVDYNPSLQEGQSIKLANAIILKIVKPKYVPTIQDYERGMQNRRLKYKIKIIAINKQIAALESQRNAVERQVYVKLRKAEQLITRSRK